VIKAGKVFRPLFAAIGRSVAGQVAHRLDIMAIKVKNERAIVIRVIMGANARRPVIPPARRQGGFVECLYRIPVRRGESNMRAGLWNGSLTDPKKRFGMDSITGKMIRLTVKAFDAKSRQGVIIEGLRFFEIGNADGNVIQHVQAPRCPELT